MYKPVSPQEKFSATNDPQLSLLREFWENNYAHVILTAKADSLPTDEKELLDDYGLVGCHSSRSNDLSVHARIDSSRYVRLLWESDDDRNGHAAIFESKFNKKTERATTESRERSAEQLFDTLEYVALVVESSDFCTIEEPFERTARCINNTKKRQLVTRSDLPKIKMLCMPSPPHTCAMNAPARCSTVFWNGASASVLHFKVDVMARDANAAANKIL